MKKTTANFTHDEAETFIKALLEDLFPHGKVDKLSDFYWPDVIGHYGDDEQFDFNDIEQRVKAIKKDAKQAHFVVQSIVLIDDLILFSCRQNWINKVDNSFYDNLVFGAYRIKNKKISELWIVLNTPTVTYKEGNQNFSVAMQPFELNKKAKREFLEKLAIFQKNEADKSLKLSKQERECLYYYFHGFSAKETAQELKLSPRTVEVYLADIKDRYACPSKRELRKHFFPT